MCVVIVKAPGLHPAGAPMWQRAHAGAGVRHLRGAACAAPAGLPRSTLPPRTAPSELANAATEPSDIKKSSYLRTMDLG